MSETSDTKQLSAHVADTRFEDLPPAVVELAKFKTLDMLGCFVYGVAVPGASPAVRVALSRGGVPEATIACQGQRVPAELAALANGTAAHSFEMDDRQPASALHPGSAMVPAGLAVAESRQLSGADYLAALTLGHDVGCRIGAAIGLGGKRPGFHGMGSWASIGAAAVAAKAMGLDAARVEQVIGISTATSFAMDFSNYAEGAKGYHAGKAAWGGVMAAQLVEAGMVGPQEVLEDRLVDGKLVKPGYLSLLAERPNTERMMQDLGSMYELENTGTKRYPGDGCMQAGIDAVRHLVREHDIKPDEIEAINVHTMTHVAVKKTNQRIDGAHQAPRMPIDALFSYPHVLAVAVVDGDVTPEMALPPAWNRDDLDAVRQKVNVLVDREYDDMWPAARPARVEIATSRGTFETTVLHSKGTAQNPMTWDEYVEKFMLLAEDSLGTERATEVADKVGELDRLGDVSELTSLLRPEAHSPV